MLLHGRCMKEILNLMSCMQPACRTRTKPQVQVMRNCKVGGAGFTIFSTPVRLIEFSQCLGAGYRQVQLKLNMHPIYFIIIINTVLLLYWCLCEVRRVYLQDAPAWCVDDEEESVPLGGGRLAGRVLLHLYPPHLGVPVT